MKNAIEIRHYVSRVGKEVFDDWLTGLADARTQAKIASRINRLAAGNFDDVEARITDVRFGEQPQFLEVLSHGRCFSGKKKGGLAAHPFPKRRQRKISGSGL